MAERLNGGTRLPALPAEVAQAFVAVWQQAIRLAQQAAEARSGVRPHQRQVLDAERERVRRGYRRPLRQLLSQGVG